MNQMLDGDLETIRFVVRGVLMNPIESIINMIWGQGTCWLNSCFDQETSKKMLKFLRCQAFALTACENFVHLRCLCVFVFYEFVTPQRWKMIPWMSVLPGLPISPNRRARRPTTSPRCAEDRGLGNGLVATGHVTPPYIGYT